MELSTSPARAEEYLPICEECGEVFTTWRGLSSHMKKHQAPVECPECHEQVRYLVPHMRAKHGPDRQEKTALDAVQVVVDENRRLRMRIAEMERERDV